jgi:hypothetical protein
VFPVIAELLTAIQANDVRLTGLILRLSGRSEWEGGTPMSALKEDLDECLNHENAFFRITVSGRRGTRARSLHPYRSPRGDGGSHVQHLNPKHIENPGIISAVSPGIATLRSNAVVVVVDRQEA